MPLFFFGLKDRDAFVPDLNGLPLADLAVVQREALRGARDIVAESIRKGEPADSQAFEITDEQGEVVHVLAFRDVYRLS